VIYRGTRDGLTCSRLLEREGAVGLIGPKSFLGLLATKGFTILPSVDAIAAPEAAKPDAAAAGDGAPAKDAAAGNEQPASKRTSRGATKWTSAIGHEVRFNGGYIVAHYGSQSANGVDAIQLEFGGRLRDDEMLKTARAVGDAVAEWVMGREREFSRPEEREPRSLGE
jgi:hypothetical protein